MSYHCVEVFQKFVDASDERNFILFGRRLRFSFVVIVNRMIRTCCLLSDHVHENEHKIRIFSYFWITVLYSCVLGQCILQIGTLWYWHRQKRLIVCEKKNGQGLLVHQWWGPQRVPQFLKYFDIDQILLFIWLLQLHRKLLVWKNKYFHGK